MMTTNSKKKVQSRNGMQIILLFFLSILLCSTSLQAQMLFKVTNFAVVEDDLNMQGMSKVIDSTLFLTSARPNQAGSVWFNVKRINLEQGFETEFEFKVTSDGKGTQIGDGFAFVIQDGGVNALGRSGEELGYGGINSGLVMEFDTYNNDEGSKNHIDIAIYDRTKKIYARHATVHAIPEVSDGKPHVARIHYKDGFFTLYLDSYLFPVLSSRLDLPQILGSNDKSAWIGFTAATSAATANHQILSWTIEEKIDAPEDIKVEEVEVSVSHKLDVVSRKIKIGIWDHNKVDGDIVSLRYGDKWLVTGYPLTKEPKYIELTLTGFADKLVMFANNVGSAPPNTASISVDDGVQVQTLKLQSDKQTSEAIQISHVSPE